MSNTALEDFIRRLDKVWKVKNKLERECRVQYQKLHDIPELSNSYGDTILTPRDRSTLFKRIRYFRLLEMYKNTIMCCDALGYKVMRTLDGKHSIVSNESHL